MGLELLPMAGRFSLNVLDTDVDLDENAGGTVGFEAPTSRRRRVFADGTSLRLAM